MAIALYAVFLFFLVSLCPIEEPPLYVFA